MGDNADIPSSDIINEEKGCETKCLSENDKENNKQMKRMSGEPVIGSSEALQLSESQSDPVCILQMSGEQILAPETEDDGISIIPPSPGAYGDPPYLIPTSPGEQIGDEDSDENNLTAENLVKGETTSSLDKSDPSNVDVHSEEPSTAKTSTPHSACCKISFSQDSTDESLEIAETQTSLGEIEVHTHSRKRKHIDEPLGAKNTDSTSSSDKLSIQHMMSRSKNHDKKVARVETEREEEPSLKSADPKQTCMEMEAEKQYSDSPSSKAENPDSKIDDEENEWCLQLSCPTEPMEYSLPEDLSLEEKQKDSSDIAEAVHEPDKEVTPENDNCSEVQKDDAALPLFQIQKPTGIEQSSTTSDTREDTTVFSHIQSLGTNVLEISEELTDECVATPEELNRLNSTIENSDAIKNAPLILSDTEPEHSSVSQISADQMKDKNIEDAPLQSTQTNGASNNLSQFIGHKIVKGRRHPVIFTDSLEEQESISYKGGRMSSIIESSKSIKHHKAPPIRNKDGKQPSNIFPTDGNSVKPSEVCGFSPSKTLDLGIQVNIDSFECSKCSNRQNLCSPSSDKQEAKDRKTYKKIITTVRHITTQQVIVDGKVVKQTVIEEEDEPVIVYQEEDISPTVSSHRTSISHTSFSSGELADVSSLVTSKSISGSSSSSLFAFPRSSSVRRSSSQEKSLVTKSRTHTHQDASTDTDVWSDTKQADKYAASKKNKTKWKLNSESIKTSSLCSSSPEIPISDVSQPNQSRTVLPGVRVMARWKDGCFYPGKVCAQDSDKKWVILYDDGGKIPVPEKDLIIVSLLEKGQRVLALSEDGCYDPGIIKDYYKEGKEVGYVVERDYNETTRYPRSSIILSNEEAISLLKSDTDTSSASSGIEQGNIPEGRRRQSPRVTVSQGKKEKSKTCQDPFVDISLSDKQNSSSDGMPQRRSARKKLKQNDEKESTKSDIIIISPQELVSPRRRDSPSCKRKLQTTNEQCVDIPGTSKKSSHCETTVKTGEKESTFKSPKVQKAERCKISKLTGEAGKKDNEKLFEGFAFLLSTADRKSDDTECQSNDSSTDLTEEELIPKTEVPFDKNLIEKEIEARGGTVLENIEGIQNMKGKQILLLSNDYLRTIKYIHCLAEGIPCVSHIWIKDCCVTNKIQNYITYLLPAGFDIINKCVVEWHGRKDALKGLHILLFSFSNKHFVDIWSPVLMAAEAKIVHRIPPQRKSTDSPCNIDAVVTDPSCPQNILRRATQLKIPVLSVEWVIQCLITGHRLPVDSHPKFNYDFRA